MLDPSLTDDPQLPLPTTTSAPVWAAAATVPPLRPAVIQLWRVPVREVPLERAWRLLSPAEQARVQRQRRGEDQRLLAAAYASARVLIAAALGQSPRGLRFHTGPHGKPGLTPKQPLQFNLSHSGERCLIALCADRAVGVDVERSERGSDALELAARFFHPAEIAVLRALPAARRPEAFIRLWVCKEAYVKARGRGITFGLHNFNVPLITAPNAPPQPIADPSASTPGWAVKLLEPDDRYLAAVAARDFDWTVQLYSFRFDDFVND